MTTPPYAQWWRGLLLVAFFATASARAQNVSASFSDTSDWGSGFTGEIALKNQTGATIQNWVIEVDFAGKFTSVWNGVELSVSGNTHRLGPASWNNQIPVGGSISVGFVGAPGKPVIAPNAIRVTYSAVSGSSGGTTPPPPSTPPPAPTPPPPTATTVGLAGVADEQDQVDIASGGTTFFTFSPTAARASLSVSTNNASVVQPTIAADGRLSLQTLKPGRAGLRITNSATGLTRYLGVRVLNPDGTAPGLPSYLGIGSVSEDTDADLNFWRAFAGDGTNKRMDFRYIYLAGGPLNQGGGWRTWSGTDGGRATTFVRNSLRLGMIPFFVYYNVPDGGESYFTDKSHFENQNYMLGYFQDLKFALELTGAEAGNEMVGFVLEPDLIGYFAQNDPRTPDQIFAYTDQIYAAGLLTAADPNFPNTLHGFVQAVNYAIHKKLPNAYFGWQFNLWASPAGGWTTPIGGKGVVHLTDTLGLYAGRTAIYQEASAIADYYIACGVLTNGAKFVSIDKYGLDAGYEGLANNPSQSTWFWNAPLWTNYLIFVNAMHNRTGLPVVLWQLPVGHINQSLAADPYAPGQGFPVLNNTSQHYEDSAPGYFFGDTFAASTGTRQNYFSATDGGVSSVSVAGNNVTWGRHLDLAEQAGVNIALFGAGVGDSTHGTGSPPTDSYWWISAAQHYYQNPVALSTPPAGIPVGSGNSTGGSGGTTTPPPPPPTSLLAQVTFADSNDWGSGFTGYVTIKNTGTQNITSWTIAFDTPFRIDSVWNAVITQNTGQHYVLKAESWNGSIAPGASVSVGFNGSPGRPAGLANVVLTSDSTTVKIAP